MKSKTTNLRTEVRDIGCALHAALCRERCVAGYACGERSVV